MLLPLSEILLNYLPDEKIITSCKVSLRDSWSIKNLSKSQYWYLSPLNMIETQNYFFFDRRQPYLSTLSKHFLISPLLIGGFALFLWLYVWQRTPQSLVLVVFSFILGFLVPIINYYINQGLANIVVLKKKWITENKKQDNEFILEGTIPKDESYVFVRLLPTNTQKRLSLVDRMFVSYYTKNINTPSVSFTFKYQLVK